MHKVRQIHIGGFKRLRDFRLDMRPLTVVIGANGVGKSSLLEAISLLAASAAGSLQQSLSNWGGVAGISTREPAGGLYGLAPGQTVVPQAPGNGGIVLGADMEVPGHEPLEYFLNIKPDGPGYSIASERLVQTRNGDPQPFKHIEAVNGKGNYFNIAENRLAQPDWQYDALETFLSQVPKMFSQPEEFRAAVSSVAHYHALDVGPRSPVKLPQPMKPAASPGANGEDLIPFLYDLRERDKDRFDVIEDTLRAAFPGFERLNFPPVAAGTLSMTWKEKYFRDPVYPHQLSEGTLRFLWLVALLQAPHPATFTMIDEPEVSMHPEMLRLFAELLREAAARGQIIVATHSDVLIRFLQPSEVLVMDLAGDGCAKAQWADALDLDDWLAEYTLDEVWRMGRLGGRP